MKLRHLLADTYADPCMPRKCLGTIWVDLWFEVYALNLTIFCQISWAEAEIKDRDRYVRSAAPPRAGPAPGGQ